MKESSKTKGGGCARTAPVFGPSSLSIPFDGRLARSLASPKSPATSPSDERLNKSFLETREALLQSQKMDAIGQLTGGIAHDFNNLLMAVIGSLELMRKRLPNDPKLVALLDNAVHGAKRGATLTNRMLAFARRQELKQEPVDIPELVRGMTELLQRSLGPSISIETRFPLVSKPVLGDANQLEMILLNLTVNARDAMPDGGQIVIATREEVLRETAAV